MTESIGEKIKALNLLPNNAESVALVLELDPIYKLIMDDPKWDFVCIYKGTGYFYSEAYIAAHTLSELKAAFALVSLEGQVE